MFQSAIGLTFAVIMSNCFTWLLASTKKCLLFYLAIDLINRLLQIKMRKRFTADKSLAHNWLQVNLPCSHLTVKLVLHLISR